MFCALSIEDLAPIQGKSDNKRGAGGGLSLNVAAVIESSLAGQGQPEAETVLLAYRDKRFEQPVANLFRGRAG
jgi:hypothetical protein